MRTDHRIDLLRSVGDDSPWYEKALFHALTALEELDEGGSHVNHPQHVAARALEKIERELAEYEPHV